MSDRSPKADYAPLGNPDEPGLCVRFEPGFGLNVYVELRSKVYANNLDPRGYRPSRIEATSSIALSVGGWERLCELVDEYRARSADQGEHR